MSTETKLAHTFPKGGPKLVWEMKKGTGYSSPAISGDRLVMFHRVGSEERVECLHRETGASSNPTTRQATRAPVTTPKPSLVIANHRKP